MEYKMTYRPISFNLEMTRAVLSGRKTQTRRVVKIQPDAVHDGEPYWNIGGYRAWQYRGINDVLRMGTNNPSVSPFGNKGDRLWLRESTQLLTAPKHVRPGDEVIIRYAADHEERKIIWPERIKPVQPGHLLPNGCFKEAARIWLEIESVRVERLQDISEEDALAEGVSFPIPVKPGHVERMAREAFADLWASLYCQESWDASPWVWVISFRRI